MKNDGRNLSIGAASFDALLDGKEHFYELQVMYIYLHAKLFVHGLYNTTGDLSDLKVDKLAQHLNCVSALYYLFHIRSCATSTQGRNSESGPGLQATGTESHSMQMITQIGIDCLSLLQHCPLEFVELLKLLMRSCCRGFHAFKDYITFKVAYTWFSYRSRRTLVSMPSNGYSGILALQAFEDYFQGLSTPSLRNYEILVCEGHKKLARALRQHRVELCNLCRQFYGGKVSKIIHRRAAMFDRMKYNVDCRVPVGEPLDLFAWCMAMNRNICIVTHGNRKVLIFSKQSLPRLVPLMEFRPSGEDVVLFLKDNHFDSLVLKGSANVVSSNVETEEVAGISESMPYPVPTGGGDNDPNEEHERRRASKNDCVNNAVANDFMKTALQMRNIWEVKGRVKSAAAKSCEPTKGGMRNIAKVTSHGKKQRITNIRQVKGRGKEQRTVRTSVRVSGSHNGVVARSSEQTREIMRDI